MLDRLLLPVVNATLRFFDGNEKVDSQYFTGIKTDWNIRTVDWNRADTIRLYVKNEVVDSYSINH